MGEDFLNELLLNEKLAHIPIMYVLEIYSTILDKLEEANDELFVHPVSTN